MIITDWVLLIGLVLIAVGYGGNMLNPRKHRTAMFLHASYGGLVLVIVGVIGRIFFMFLPL